MDFLSGVNRVLRSNGILRGDDDDLTTFASTQHSATLALAKISIEDQLGALVSDTFIPFEEKTGTITFAASQRLYSLASDFVRFQQSPEGLAMFRVVGGIPDNHFIPYIDEMILRNNFADYRETEGTVTQFYIPKSTTKQVGMWNVPNTSGTVYRYYYEKDVSVTLAADNLPFVSSFESNIFIRMASRHFSLLFQQTGKPQAQDPDIFEKDAVLLTLRAQLIEAMKPFPHSKKWIN